MSNSGYRGRSFGPRGAHTNGPANGYNGPRFPHPNFNLPRRPHRLPGPEQWIERPSFGQWQQNNNFLLHPQYRNNIQFRPNGRGRAGGGHGLLRFSGPGRPPAPQFCMGYKRNLLPRGPLPQEELIEGKTTLSPQPPLLGSEEERLQKISETANKLKEKLSSITEEELTNFWEDDLSILSNNGCEEGNIEKKSISELSHEPPELDLTFTDFRDIGRVDCNNSKSDNVDNESSDEISIIFLEKPVDKDKESNNEVVADNENKDEYSIPLDLENDKDDFDQSNISLENERHSDQMHHELSDFECTVENSNSQNIKAKESSTFSNASESELSSKSLNENATDSAPVDVANKLTAEKSLNANDTREVSISKLVTNSLDFSGNQNTVQVNVPNEDKDIPLHSSLNVHHDIYTDTNKLECKEIPDDTQTTSSPETTCQNVADVCESPKSGEFNVLQSNEKILPSIICDSTLATRSTCNEVHKFNDDNNINKTSTFQPRSFSKSPRLYLRIAGPKNHWTFSQNGKNLFFRGAQRLPFHGNRTSSPRHVAPFPVDFDPRAPPPFTSSELPPAFDPSEPPPNIRPLTEPSNRQEKIHGICSMDPRNQPVNSSQSNMKVVQSPVAFDPRGPPPRILNKAVSPDKNLPEFNPQQPPPKIHKREQTLQPPPIFDPRLSSEERSNLIAPLNSSRSNLIPINLMETQQVTDYSIGLVAPNFSQLPPISIPPHQTFIPNVQMNFQPTLSKTNSGQAMMKEFALPPPSVNINAVPPLQPKVSLAEENPNLNPNISMDDGLEDMQEAMEFAKQIMNMSEETKNENTSPVYSAAPTEIASHCSLMETENIHSVKKQKKREGKVKQSKTDICKPDLIVEKQGAIEIVDKGECVQSQTKNSDDILLSSDQIRPKVVFNLNSKAKKIHKLEEWHRTPIFIPENRDNSHQSTSRMCSKEKIQFKKHSSESKRSSVNQNKSKQTEDSVKKDSNHSSPVINLPVQREPNDKLYQKDYKKNSENLHSHTPSKVTSTNMNVQKGQKAKDDDTNATSCTLETSWKNKVINRFLKMSKNDICNMVNNSSLRKFDIAMKHLVKERRSFLSLEMRNTEDEKMKEYDREEFMNQLNAMLDPTAVVAITDLPTEFIHHLSEVLQLERMPFVAELSESQNIDLDNSSESETSRIHVSQHSNQDHLETEHFAKYTESQNVHNEHREIADTVYHEEKPPDFCLTTDLTLNILKEDTNSSYRSLSSNINPEAESTLKKHQQPLFNEADLDDILSEVTEKTKNVGNSISSLVPDKSTETRTSSSFTQAVITEAFEYNTFSQIPNKTAADLDDIFSAGIARVKQLGKSSTDSDNSRIRKSNSEERNTFKSERYKRWNRKEREDPDTFRNLTKEEWEAKYGPTNATIASTISRKSISNSAENLSKDINNFHGQRDCLSASPKRHASLSPSTCEAHTSNLERCNLNEVEESESSSDSITSSSSESDEETVAPNVTKLLKVIKEKEKIAKKKSINETIRDEVAAEIEKTWKEKSKYKERKSRKREKRKKDKREKRRKEKKKKRWRNSHSGSSKSSEYLEGFRLLTENEIKKEVIVKEEPVSSFEEHAVVGGGTDNTYVAPQLVNKVIDTQIQPQSLQVHKDQFPTITSDMTFSQFANKMSTTSVVIQPKTKAQLKQMPELSNVELEPAMEEQVTRVTKINSIINTDIEIKTNALSSTNTSVHQVNILLNTEGPPSFVSPPVEATNNNIATHVTMQPCNISNPVAETNVSNQCIDRKTFTSSTENKSGNYKKIDIKAYKERALQRRLKEQSVLNESSASSTSVIQDSCSIAGNKTNAVSTNIANEVKNEEMDETKMQLKDPRLTRLKSSSTHSLEDLSNEIIEMSKEKPLEGEENTIRLVEFELNTPKYRTKCIEQKNQNESLAQEANTVQDIEKLRSTEKLKLPSKERELKKSITATEVCKFKNIRSEGSKELKLKKEKIKKIVERKKKKDTKPTESKSHADKYSSTKASEGNQESSTETTDIIPQEETDIQSVIQRKNEDGKLGDIDRKDAEQILEKQQIVDQDIKNKDEEMSGSVENKMNNVLESVSTETASKGKTVCKVIVQMDLISFDHDKLIFSEKYRESIVPSVSKSVKEVSCPLGDHVDASIEKCINSTNTARCEDSLGTEMNLEDTREANNVNIRINGATHQNKIKTIPQLHESVENTSICGKTVQNEARSPDSPSSPFKGFIVDLAECGNHQVSQSSCLKMNCESDKENLKDNSKEWPTTSSTDKLASKSAKGDKSSAKRFKKRKEENETMSISSFIEERKDVTDEMDNSLNFTDSISISWDAENVEEAEEKNQSSYVLVEEKKTSSAALTDSHDIFNEDGEPFIVLDEYVDDTDGKSVEKLDTRNLDLEECIARDADIFADEPIQGGDYLSGITKSLNFSAMDCKKLSEVVDKSNINIDQNQGNMVHAGEKLKNLSPKRNIVLRTELLASKEGTINATDVVSSTSESNIESTLKSSKLTKVIASTVAEIPIESSQNIISTTSKDTSQRSIFPELPSSEVAGTAEENNDCTNISEYNIQHMVTQPNIQEQKDKPDTSRMIITCLESEISSKLPESKRPTAPQTALTLKTNAEAIELYKQRISDQTSRQGLNDHHFDKNVSTSSEQSVTLDKNVSFDSISDQEVAKSIRKTIFKKSNQRKNYDPLHKVKYTRKMKHRKQKCDIAEKLLKDAAISDAVKNKYPSTKEAILARMIEIDVEIHKLMTEKMTLYQMLTNDTSTTDNNLQQNNLTQQEGESDNTVIRPQTPSLLMSQLLQNIDVSPATTENVPSKDNSIDSVQLNKGNTSCRYINYTDGKGHCSSTCGSVDKEMVLQSGSDKSVRKRKRQKSEGLVKKLQNKQDREKERFSDMITLESKKNSKKSEQESSKTSTIESQPQKKANEISTGDILTDNNALNSDKIIKTTELQTYTEEIMQAKDTELSVEMPLSKDNEVSTAISNKEIINANWLIRSSESRTPEKVSIYSDDSTWDSFLQTSSVDDQKKSNTGLALLEETYRKEMETIRKLKAETRKRRKKKLQNILQTMHFTLTSEEEELPLSTLCIKKFFHEKGVPNSSEQETQRHESDDPEIWKNVDNIINAVAENRTEGLRIQSLGEESSGIGEDALHDISNPEQNADSRKDKNEQTIKWATLKNVESACTETRVNVEISCEHKDARINNFAKDSLNVLSSKLQEREKNERVQRDLNMDVVLKNVKDISGISRNDTSTNTETNFVEFTGKQIVNNDNIEIDEKTSTEDSDPCHMILSLSSTHDKPNVTINVENLHAENIEKGKEDIKESNLQSTISTIQDIATEKSNNSLSTISSEIADENVDNSTKIASDKNIVTSETILKDDTKYLSTFNKQGNNVDGATEELNCVSQNEHFIRFKEHKELYKKGEIDRCSTASSEENNNQNFADVVLCTENLETLRSDGTFDKKLSKRKRGSNKAPLRRSSRYTDEPTKRVKLEIDTSTLNLDQELQDKNFRTHMPSTSSSSSSPCEEIEELLATARKSRGIQKSANSRKRYTPMLPGIEIISHEPNDEAPRRIKRCKQYTISEMMSCTVQLIDCRHTLLNPNLNPNLLQNYGISKININAHSNSAHIDPRREQSPSTKDLSNACTKQATSFPEFSRIQCSKLTKIKVDQTSSVKVKRILKPANNDLCIDDKGDCTEPDVEIMPVLIKEPVTVDISHKSENPDVEIVEEKKIVTKNQQHSNSGLTLTVIDTKEDKELPRTHYTVHKGPILDIKVFKSSFLAASEDGRIYRYNQASNGILNIYKGHKAAVTCLYVCSTTSSTDISRNWMFSGSLDGTLRCYNVMTGIQVRETADISSPIQCMDEAWGIIFIGTKSGHVSRYHMKSGSIKGDSIQFSDKSVLALKATNEGPRKVLIVASRSQPITIRDAQTGLFLRTICGQKNHTVYSLMRDNNLIYCGTSSTSIPVFDFTNGEQTIQYDAGVGIVCMRLYKQLLFAGCYDGNIYVFDTKDNRLVCSIPGPGNMLLSMEVVDNKIIAGSKDKRLQSWQMPWQARSLF